MERDKYLGVISDINKLTDKDKEYIVNDVLAINKVWYEELQRHTKIADAIKKGE